MLIFVLGVWAAGFTFGDERLDRIWIEPAATTNAKSPFLPRAISQVVGAVETFDDETLVYVVGGETALPLSSARVVWVEPAFDDATTTDALALYRKGEYQVAIAPLLQVISQGPPVWQAQWLSMHLWNAAYQCQKYAAVLELVNQIDNRPVPLLVLGGLPLRWTNEAASPAAIEAAVKCLSQNDRSDATRLVAASWLIGQNDDRQAVETLELLSKQSERPAISQLAAVLLWRKTPPPAIRDKSRDWELRLGRLPLTLYAGPAVLAAQTWEAIGDDDRSIECLLSVALTPPRPHEVTAYAKLQAMEALRRLGRTSDLERLTSIVP